MQSIARINHHQNAKQSKKKKTTTENLQNITNYTNAPHVGPERNSIKVNHFRCNKLGCTKQNLNANGK